MNAPTEPGERLVDHASRRLEALSDIVFGLAMTFLVSRLPMPGPSQPAPSWSDLERLLGPHLVALALSFSVATLYWFGHHRRLALSPPPDALELFLNFGFLLLVMLLPTTTDLLGRYGSDGSAVSVYCTHLGLLSVLNLVLWAMTIGHSRRPGGRRLAWHLLAGPVFGTVVFALSGIIAIWWPDAAQALVYSAFLTPLIARGAAIRASRPSALRRV